VLRLELPPVDEAALAWEHSATRQLAQRLPEVCAPVVARDGTTWFPAGETVAWLMPLLPGASADPARAEDRDAAAAALGRLHAAGAALDLRPHPRLQPLPRMRWPPAATLRPLAEWASEIAEMRAWAMASVRRLAAERRPREGFIHGDFFPGNVLVASAEATGIIDWEEAHTGWLSWDLANALGTFCFAGDELDPAAARRFLTAYREAGGTAPREEEDMLLPLMRVKRILEVLRAPTDREPRWQHQRHNLRALQHLASTASVISS
jgi:Ser/Thr protein kinase RdoA (MazF antagonist)